MKTLVNKANPAIRITAPEIEVHEEEDMYFIPVSDYCIPMCMEDWTLVEEEPKHTEVWVEGRTIFEQDVKKPDVDFEKLALERWPVVMVPKDPWDVDADGSEEDLNEFDRDAYLQGLKEGYELGLKARKEE